MNEQIKLLKEQSMEWVPNMADPDTKIRLLNAGKFAELIVKETMQVVANNLPQNTYLDVADAVIEHFGVEE